MIVSMKPENSEKCDYESVRPRTKNIFMAVVQSKKKGESGKQKRNYD